MKPPSLRELLDDPIYRAYIKTVPRLEPHVSWGEPWQVWGRTVEGPWRGKKFQTYREAWPMVVKCVKNREVYQDVAIVSRRSFFAPPDNFYWERRHFSWCSRCRRPSAFRIRPNHHAMKKAPVLTLDDAKRCYFCGIRKVSMPEYHP